VACLKRELEVRSVPFQSELALPLCYKGLVLSGAYRIDLLVDGQVVVEAKSVETLQPIHEAQSLTYLRLGGWKVGLLLNFNVASLKNGIRRLVLGLGS
jgi:GxxExxY protein